MIGVEKQEKIGPIKISVIGVGGGGGNAVDSIIDYYGLDESSTNGLVKYITANTDYQALYRTKASTKLELAIKGKEGLGAGGDPEVGKKAAEENREAIRAELEGSKMVIITAGMGGGTGTGAAPIIAEVAKSIGALTVGIVTMPFGYEPPQKWNYAKDGLEKLKENVDSYIVVLNDKIRSIATNKMTFKEALHKGSDALRQAIGSIITIINEPGVINVDFADVESTMLGKGRAYMGYGVASGENAAKESIEKALNSPLLDRSIIGAKNVLSYFIASEDTFTYDDYEYLNKTVVESLQVDPSGHKAGFGFLEDANKDEVISIVIATDLPYETEESHEDMEIKFQDEQSDKISENSKKQEEQNKEETTQEGQADIPDIGIAYRTKETGQKLTLPKFLGEHLK